MHTFQPYPIDKMEFNPFTKIGKEWALVSAGDKTRCNTMTVSWGGVGVLWGKNVVFIFIRDSRYTKEFLDNGDDLRIRRGTGPVQLGEKQVKKEKRLSRQRQPLFSYETD